MRTAFAGLALLLGAAVAAAPAMAQDKQDITIRFTWKLKGEYAPLFVALDKGYYAEEGLNVTLAEGSGAQTVMTLLAAGEEKVGYGPAVAAAQAVSSGLPVQVVSLYQTRAPMGVISFPDNPVTKPSDLEGKRIGISVGETFTDMLRPFAEINGVDINKIVQIQMDNSARTTQFLTHGVDVMSVYLSNELPVLENRTGTTFTVMPVADYGLHLLGASLIVGKEWAAANPDTVRALIRATNRGYADAMANPEEAAEIMGKHMSVPEEPSVLLAQVKATMESTNAPEGKPIGYQEEADWTANLDLLARTGAIKQVGAASDYYTNDYLQ
jgi:NitT/TauT family transport system substrate-binding protein